MSKSVLISGYYGFENFGDDLILQVLVNQLKAFGVIPIVLSENPALTTKNYDVACIQRGELHYIWKALKDCDAFISGGGGLFQDITGLGSPIFYGGMIEMASWYNLPIAFFGQGIGPLRSFVGLMMLKRSIKHAELVVVRDIKSLALLQQTIDTKAELMSDPVWAWEPSETLKKSPRKGVAVSLRPWSHLQNGEITLLADCLAQLRDIRTIGVNLIDCQAGTDIVPLSKLEQLLKAREIPCRWFSELNCAQGIAQSEALIGMRYHSILIAAQLGVPVMAMSYDPKVQLLATQLKIIDFPVVRFQEAMSLENMRDAIRTADTSVVAQFQKEASRGFLLLKNWLGV
jgi:polysaccharide pyruvyl transferase CsaB